MAQYQDVFVGYLNALPPLLAIGTLLAIIGWKFWLKNNGDVTSDKALTSVSTGYRSLSDAQQLRIAQQDLQITRFEKLNTELQLQLTAALNEINRVRMVLDDVRNTAAICDAKTLRTLSVDDG